MLKEMGYAIVDKLRENLSFKQVDFYEGQLDPDKIGQWAITPPTAFVELMGGDSAEADQFFQPIRFNLHLLTTKLLHDPANMLDLVEWIWENFHGKGLRTTAAEGGTLGRTFFTGFENDMTLAGLTYYEMKLVVR
jgi:hypothetical protein